MQDKAVSDIDLSLSSPDTVYALALRQGVGIYISTDGGENWVFRRRDLEPWFSGAGSILVDRVDSRKVYASYARDSVFSARIYNIADQITDAGLTWTRIAQLEDWSTYGAVECNPVNPATIYLGIGQGIIHCSRDHGNSWSFFSQLPDSSGPSAFAIALQDTNVMYATVAGIIYKSTNGGYDWMRLSLSFPWDHFTSVAIDPTDQNVVYASLQNIYQMQGGVYKTTDGGLNWAQMNVGLVDTSRTFGPVIINPRNPNEVFVGGSRPILCYRSGNKATNWERFDAGLPTTSGSTRSLSLNCLSNRLYLGTIGIFIRDITTSAQLDSSDYPRTAYLHQNHPNPFNPTTQINYDLPEASHITLVVYDVLGRKVAELVNGAVEPGYHTATWVAENTASGVYFARFMATNKDGTAMFTKVNKLLLVR